MVTGKSIPSLSPMTYSINSENKAPPIPLISHLFHPPTSCPPMLKMFRLISIVQPSVSLLGIFQVSSDLLCDDGPPLPLSGPLGREISIQSSLSSE